MLSANVDMLAQSFEALTPQEKQAFIARILATPAPVDVLPSPTQNAAPQTGHWGRDLIALRETLHFDEWAREIADVDSVDYVRAMREDERRERLGDWGAEG